MLSPSACATRAKHADSQRPTIRATTGEDAGQVRAGTKPHSSDVAWVFSGCGVPLGSVNPALKYTRGWARSCSACRTAPRRLSFVVGTMLIAHRAPLHLPVTANGDPTCGSRTALTGYAQWAVFFWLFSSLLIFVQVSQ